MDYGNQSQPVVSAPVETSPPVSPLPVEPPRQGRGWLIFTLALLLLVAASLAWWWLARPSSLPISLGFTDRTPLTSPSYLDQKVAGTGPCLTFYQLQAGGRSERLEQTYLLSVGLAADPTTDQALAATLAQGSCQTELVAILDKLAEDLSATPESDLLTVSYLSASGQRFIIP